MPFLDSSGVTIHYEVHGAGQPVVLVHGLSSSIDRNWRRTGMITALIGSGFQAIGIDCRGHGKSAKPYESNAYDGTAMSDDVIALMDHLHLERADLVGYSMGGALVTSLLARRPERIRRAVIAGVGDWVLGSASRFGAGRPLVLDASRPRRPNPRLLPRGMKRISGNDFTALAALRNAQHAGFDAQKLAAVASPVLLLAGSADRSVGSLRRLEATIPQARIVKVPGTHFSAVAHPAFRRAIVDFLSA